MKLAKFFVSRVRGQANRLKIISPRKSILVWLILGPGVFCACDSKYNIVEAFLQNGAETKLFTYQEWNLYNLGQSVAISGDVALIGGSYGPSAYLYHWDGRAWMKQENLISNRSSSSEAVGLNGDLAVVGGGYGSKVYVYRFNGSRWQEEAILTPSDGSSDVVSVSEKVIAVGSNNNYGTGSVYLYRFNGSSWVEEAKLTASAEAYGFGVAVSVSGDVAIVGASRTYAGYREENAGAAYVYRYTGSSWKAEAKLTAGDAARGDQFGRAVAVNGNAVIVGAPYDDENIENAGSAYIFRRNGSIWQQETKLSFNRTAPSPNAYFGWAVAIEENVAIIGAPFDDDDGYDPPSEPGLAYVYQWDGRVWQEQKKLAASDGYAGNRFGAAVAINGRLAIVGAPAPYDYQRNEGGGAAYVYRLD